MNRADLLELYRAARCWLATDDGWTPIDRTAEATLAITAWNPAGRTLLDGCNHARDALLASELAALGLAPRRIRGTAADSSWHEDGWLIAHEPARSQALLVRYGQLAGYLFAADGRCVLWADGSVD